MKVSARRILKAMLLVFVVQLVVVLMIAYGAMAVVMQVPDLALGVIWGTAGGTYALASVLLAYGIRTALSNNNVKR